MSLTLVILLAVVAACYALLWFMTRLTAGVCTSKRELPGRTVIVTGANTGIGLETARGLAARKAKIILACRSIPKGEKAVRQIFKTTENFNLVVKQLDLSSFASIIEFAGDILETEDRLDVLINNAGIMAPPGNQKSADGLELTMATNHFGPFLLTNLLLPLLKRSAPSRIVMVSSMNHEWGKLDFDNLNGEKGLTKFDIYGTSKLANVLFTREMSKRLQGTGVTINSLHPGAVRTELSRGLNPLYKVAFNVFLTPFLKTAKEGAETSIYVAVSEDLKETSGKYFSDCKEKQLKKHALDEEVAKKLWTVSEEITKLKSVPFFEGES